MILFLTSTSIRHHGNTYKCHNKANNQENVLGSLVGIAPPVEVDPYLRPKPQ